VAARARFIATAMRRDGAQTAARRLINDADEIARTEST
jgi:hypothetical protein